MLDLTLHLRFRLSKRLGSGDGCQLIAGNGRNQQGNRLTFKAGAPWWGVSIERHRAQREKLTNAQHQIMKKPYEQNGLRYGYGAAGERVCTGAMMGRSNVVPTDYNGERLNLRKVPMQGDYDPGGAYWGMGRDSLPLYCAWGETATEQMEVFVRAKESQRGKAGGEQDNPHAQRRVR